MKLFKFKEQVFSRFFGIFYKEHDTYKDIEGKGILERFIEVCSEYFDDDIIPEVDGYLNLLDPEKTPYKYIEFIWAYFGYIPYAYGLVKSGVPYSKDDMESWLRRNRFPLTDYRNLLKYAISLYKIRCTDKFYEVLGRFYNIKIQLIDPSKGINTNSSTYDNPFTIYDDRYIYDAVFDCLECLEMEAHIYIPKGVLDYLETNNQMQEAKQAICLIINKYLPVHIIEFVPETLIIHEDIPNPYLYLTASNT